jgi:hypothetical protein
MIDKIQLLANRGNLANFWNQSVSTHLHHLGRLRKLIC